VFKKTRESAKEKERSRSGGTHTEKKKVNLQSLARERGKNSFATMKESKKKRWVRTNQLRLTTAFHCSSEDGREVKHQRVNDDSLDTSRAS